MTTAETLADLQAAWHRPPVVVSAPAKPRRCDQHTNRADWLDEPAANRTGWIRTTCRRCGGFIGYHLEVAGSIMPPLALSETNALWSIRC
ncbi:MAG: hypothetical protein H8E66_24205 [Planctomycetes bacterium]|nr:hypothetical protein [Planctomycetota bacterium]